MDQVFLDCSAHNPMRKPHWRWDRAKGVCAGSQPPAGRTRDGLAGFKWINRAVTYTRAKLQYTRLGRLDQLASRFSDIFWAEWIHDHDTHPLRWELEARLLSRSTDNEIAMACGTTAEVVRAYEALFFNVREKLHHTGYIVHTVMGESVHRGLAERDYDLLWKMYAYAHGPHMLTSLITKFVNPIWCNTPDEVNSAIHDDTIATLKLKSSLAAKTVQVNGGTQIELLQIYTKFVEIEQLSDSAGKAQSQILDHINVMFSVMPLNIGGRDPRSGQQRIAGPSNVFDTSAVELSYDETVQVAVGQKLPHAEMLQQLDFPPVDGQQSLAAGGSQ